MDLETKSAQISREIRPGAEPGLIEGYAAVFNSVDSDGDTMLPGAFDAVIKSGKLPAMFYGHRHADIPIGRWESIEADAHGLKVKGHLDLNLPDGRNVYEAVKFGSLSGLSIGFQFGRDDYELNGKGRTFKNVIALPEISIVAMPAEPQAQISAVKAAPEIRQLEDELHAAGLSRTVAAGFVTKAKKIFTAEAERRDDDDALKMIAAQLQAAAEAIAPKPKRLSVCSYMPPMR